jgi:hypothetical protein
VQWTQLIKKLNNFISTEDTWEKFEVARLTTHQEFCCLQIPTCVPFTAQETSNHHAISVQVFLNISGITDNIALTIILWNKSGCTLWVNIWCLLHIRIQNSRQGSCRVIKEVTQYGHLDPSTFLWIAEWEIQWQVTRNVAVTYLAGRCIHKLPVAQHSSLAMSRFVMAVTICPQNNNGPITPALANPQCMFHFWLSHSFLFTSQGIWDRQMWWLWQLT